MKVSEFKKKLEIYNDDLEVVVDLAPSGHVGSGGTIGVKHLQEGFDWDMGKLILSPEKHVDIWYEKCKKCAIPGNCTKLTSRISYDDLGEGKYSLKLYFDGKEIGSIPITSKNINGEYVWEYGNFKN